MVDSLVQDIRHGLRHLRRSPGFALAALVTLGLAIGANSAMFSLVYALILRPVPIKDPHGLVAVSARGDRNQRSLTPIPAVEVLSRADSPLQNVCGYNAGVLLPIESNGAATQAVGGLVTGGCFEAFGVPPLMGRTITDEDAPIFARGRMVTVISHRLWTRFFNADPSAIGRKIRVEGATLEIVGVMPEGFIGLHPHSGIEFFTAFDTWSPARPDRRPAASHIVGRLRPGITFAQASQQMSTGWAALMEFAAPATMPPAERKAMLSTQPLLEHFGTGFSITRELYGGAVTLMFGLTVLLLALACLNLGGLLLSRAIERGPETAMRLALGGGRWRIARQVLIENVLIALGGAALAVPVAFALVAVVVSFLPNNAVAADPSYSPDGFVIAMTAAVGVAAGFVMSLLPIWLTAPTRTFAGIGAHRTISPATAYWTRGLLVVQVALSMTMVVGALLIGRSLYNLQRADTGVQADGVLLARLWPLPNAYRTINNTAYYPPLVERIAALRGVRSVGYSRTFPSPSLHTFPGDVAAFVGDPDGGARAYEVSIAPGFFETLGVPLVAGRLTRWSDNATSPQVAVVSEALARALQPDGNVVGRRVRVGGAPQNQNVEIIGVVRNHTMGHSRRTDLPMFYRPGLQTPFPGHYPSLVIRHDPRARAEITAGLRQIAADGGKEFLLTINPLQALLDRGPASERMGAAVAIPLAALAIILAFVGVFGVLAYAVSRRTREIGVRAAVGADPASVMWMVMREGAMLSAIGVAIGIPTAYASGQLLNSITFEITRGDPVTFGLVTVFFVALGLVAGLVPARRAARVDPVIALRAE